MTRSCIMHMYMHTAILQIKSKVYYMRIGASTIVKVYMQ
jgi:hypothetical protein